MSAIDKLYLGTWQFADIDNPTAIQLIKTAQAIGIHNFDTARVYAHGKAERLLGQYCTEDATIVTKVPAIHKQATTLSEAYPFDYTVEQIEASVSTLGRMPDSLLLHNWNSQWEHETQDVVASLKEYVKSYGIARFGVSLPNDYQGALESTDHFTHFDDVELPFNSGVPSLDSARIKRLSFGKKVLARSLFMHGKDKSNIQNKIANALATNAYVVIGATKPKQIEEWKEMVQRYE